MLGVVRSKVWPVSNFASRYSMQKSVKTDATCTTQQCCVRLHRAIRSLLFIVEEFVRVVNMLFIIETSAKVESGKLGAGSRVCSFPRALNVALEHCWSSIKSARHSCICAFSFVKVPWSQRFFLRFFFAKERASRHSLSRRKVKEKPLGPGYCKDPCQSKLLWVTPCKQSVSLEEIIGECTTSRA